MASVVENFLTARQADDPTLVSAVDGLVASILDDVSRRLAIAGDDERTVHQAMEDLFHGLREVRQRSTATQWQSSIAACRCHPVRDLVHEDPFTHRAFSKPRGYAGDAELLDFIYGREELWPPPPATVLGRHIFNFTTMAPAAEGVRARRAFIASLIDRATEARRDLRMLSVAAGHLREANFCAAVRRKRFARFVALDSDALSLAQVRECYGKFGVETTLANVRRLIAGRLSLGEFDLVYSTGLFDYVGPAAGRRLVRTMFQHLRPGGRLLVANFLPGIRDAAYMEAFMDWQLLYRTRSEMIDLTMEIPQDEIGDISLFTEENRNIIFVQVRRS